MPIRATRQRPASLPRTVVAAVLLLAGLAGCREGREEGAAAAGPRAPGAAADDGPLLVYSGRSRELMTPLFERFERSSGIGLEVRWGGSEELAAALVTEGTATPADLFLSRGATPLGGLSRKGLLRELPADVVRGVPAHFAGREQKHDWAGLSGRARSVLYDPASTRPEVLPRSLEELADPRHRGRFALAPGHPSFQAQVAAYRVRHGEEALDDLLARVHANDPRLYASEQDVLRAVSSGEATWGLVEHDLPSRGEPEGAGGRVALHFMDVDGATFVDVAGVGVLSGDPRALELVRFLLDEEAQDHFAEQAHEYPLARGTPPEAGLPTLEALRAPRVDFADVAAVLEETRRALRRHGLAAAAEGRPGA